MSNISNFKQAMSNFATGITVITSSDEENQFGLTVNAFSSVSIEPLMILICLDKKTRLLPKIKQKGQFVVNILSDKQSDLIWEFAQKDKRQKKFSNEFSEKFNLPILKDSISILECQISQIVEAGDHEVILAEVITIVNSELQPLIYVNGGVLK